MAGAGESPPVAAQRAAWHSQRDGSHLGIGWYTSPTISHRIPDPLRAAHIVTRSGTCCALNTGRRNMTETKRSPRPFRPSRKKYGQALAALKQAVALPSLPWTQRLRAAELIIAIYGVAQLAPVPPMTGHNRKVVKELVEESRFETAVRKEVRGRMAEQIEADERAQIATVNPAQLAAQQFLEGGTV